MDAVIYLHNNPVQELTYLLTKVGRSKLETMMFPVTGPLADVPVNMQKELFRTYGRLEIVSRMNSEHFAKNLVTKRYYSFDQLRKKFANNKYRSLAWKYVRMQLEDYLEIWEESDFTKKVRRFVDALIESEYKILNSTSIVLQPDISVVIDSSEPKIDTNNYVVLSPELLKEFSGKVYYIRTDLDGFLENDYESYLITSGTYEDWIQSGVIPLKYDSGQIDRKGRVTKFDPLIVCNDGRVTSSCSEYLYFLKKLVR